MTLEFSQLNQDLKFLNTIYGEENIFGVFLFGQTKTTEAIIIPTFREICLNEELINTSILHYGRLIYIKDIRFTYHATRDGHTEMIEGLFTDNYILNPRYEFMYDNLFRPYRDKIAAGAISGTPPEELATAIQKVMRAALNENSPAVKFIKKCTDAEKLGVQGIVNAVGDEGIFSQAKVASAVGISRVAMSNLVLKMQLLGIAVVEYEGNKGTYIKILDDTIKDIKGEN